MRAADNLLASWDLVQEGKASLSHLERGSALWELSVEKADIILTIHDIDGLISLLEEILEASAPLREHLLNFADAIGYEPGVMFLGKLSVSDLSKFAWVGDVLASKGKRLDIVHDGNTLVAFGRDTKPGLLGLAGMKYMEAPRKLELLGIMKKIQPLIGRLK